MQAVLLLYDPRALVAILDPRSDVSSDDLLQCTMLQHGLHVPVLPLSKTLVTSPFSGIWSCARFCIQYCAELLSPGLCGGVSVSSFTPTFNDDQQAAPSSQAALKHDLFLSHIRNLNARQSRKIISLVTRAGSTRECLRAEPQPTSPIISDLSPHFVDLLPLARCLKHFADISATFTAFKTPVLLIFRSA